MFEAEAVMRLCVQCVLLNHCGLCFYFRHRPALGECLAHLAAAMPVAYLEPHLNEYNAFSVYTTKTPRERASECVSLNVNTPQEFLTSQHIHTGRCTEQGNVVLKVH